MAAVLAAFSLPAEAQVACGERAIMVEKLASNYAERPVAMGLTSKGAVLEVFTSEIGTWTFLITMPDGLTCMVASGQNWEDLTPPDETAFRPPA